MQSVLQEQDAGMRMLISIVYLMTIILIAFVQDNLRNNSILQGRLFYLELYYMHPYDFIAFFAKFIKI